jgi:hypothetical protein
MNYEFSSIRIIFLLHNFDFYRGLAFYTFLNRRLDFHINYSVFWGECLLLGSIWVIGEMIFLSLIHQYSAAAIIGVVSFQMLFWLSRNVRENLKRFLSAFRQISFIDVLFGILISVFVFRNLYYLVDVDSHSTYLFAQNLWLSKATSLIGDVATDVRVFVPHFNAVPYALGISLFGREGLLFCQLIVVSWSLIVLLLVYGYTKYRLNALYGLAAAVFVCFNDHFFYSGANKWVIINSAITAFIFASAYNFWEGRHHSFRFWLACIFVVQLAGNKYQAIIIMAAMVLVGLFICEKKKEILGGILNTRWMIGLLSGILVMSFWYIKNQMLMGLATFPIFAAKFGIFNWVPEMYQNFDKIYAGPLKAGKIIKYFSYLLVWPGIDTMKYLAIFIIMMPFLLLLNSNKTVEERLKEMSYWLAMSFLIIFGLCSISFVDPRHYRYGIAVFTFCFIFLFDSLIVSLIPLKRKALVGAIILLFVSLKSYQIALNQEGFFGRPTFKENFAVLSNKLRFSDIVNKYFPNNKVVDDQYFLNQKQFLVSAWDTGIGGGGCAGLSTFLLPIHPQVGLWHTTVVKWSSYGDKKLIEKDLRDFGIYSIMRVIDGKLVFIDLVKYSEEAWKYPRFSDSVCYNYHFPEELARINE